MKKPQLQTPLLLAVLFSAITGALAQEQGAEANEQEKKELNFSCLYWDGAPPEPLYYRDGEAFHPLKFKQGTRSKAFTLKETPQFELYRDAKFIIEDQPPYELLGKTALPKSLVALFVIIPFGEGEGIQYRVVAMDDSLNAFPPGTFRFANFTEESLHVKCGDTMGKIPAKELSVMKGGDSPDGGFVPFIIGNSKGKTVFGTRIFGQPSGRELVFISPPAKTGGIPRVKFISQLIPPAAPEPNP